ncbi:MAG: M42 family metallopeptidase [Acidobacteriota bacterium]
MTKRAPLPGLKVCVFLCLAGSILRAQNLPNAPADTETTSLLRSLTLAQGTSDDEGRIRSIIRAQLGPSIHVDETPAGDLVARFPGTAPGPVILLSSHMDEVGFQVRSITPDGFLTVAPLGNWYAGAMADHLVSLHTSHGTITGVVGIRPPHLMSAAEKSVAPGVTQMYIDIGASSASEARQWGVQPGDRITPQSDFFRLGSSSRYVSKAWDDRVGCAVLLQLARKLAATPHPNTIDIAWTTSEEFGRANATVEMPQLHPDFVLVVEVGITTDTPDVHASQQQEKLGLGPTLDLYDGSISTTPAIRDWVAAQATDARIPLQYTTILQEGAGVGPQNNSYLFRAPGTALLIPLRYAHSPHGVIDLRDVDNTRQLLLQLMRHLNASALRQMTGKDPAPADDTNAKGAGSLP